MVPVDEAEVEATAFTEESGQDDLRFVGIVIDHVRHSRISEHLKAAVPEPILLMGIDDHVPRVGPSRAQKALADVQG